MKATGFASGLVCLLFALSGNVFGNDFAGTYGLSAKAMGRGNAVASTVCDWSSVYYNISGLGKKPGDINPSKKKELTLKKKGESGDKTENSQKARLNQVSVSFLYSTPFFSLNIKRPDVRSDEDLDARIALIGATLDINTIFSVPSWLISTARIGIGAGMPAGAATKVNDVSQETHNFLAYGREAEQAVVMGGMGLGFLNDTFGIGAGVNLAFGGEGVMRMEDLELGSGEQNPTSQAKIDLKTNPSFVAGLYMRPGRILPVLSGLEIGIAFRQEKMTEIEGIPASAVTRVGNAEMTMVISALESYTPDTYSFGVSYKLLFLTLSADVEYQRWSGYRISKGAEKVYETLAATAEDENNDGVTDGYLYKIPKLEDIFVFKFGVNAELFSFIDLCAGYTYQPSSVSKEKIENSRINYLDSDKHIISAGCTVHLPKFSFTGGPVDITAAFQAQYLKETKINKTIPTDLDPDYEFGGWCPAVVVEVSMMI